MLPFSDSAQMHAETADKRTFGRSREWPTGDLANRPEQWRMRNSIRLSGQMAS